jgi:hypothetical protein
MTNCFFEALVRAFASGDFHHFPYVDVPVPVAVFDPYFANHASFVSLLSHLGDFAGIMYGYTIQVTDHVTDTVTDTVIDRSYVCSHVLVDGTRVADLDMGEYVHELRIHNADLADWLRKGYYDGGGATDYLLVLLCEFTGIEIRVQIPTFQYTEHFPKTPDRPKKVVVVPARTVVYTRLNTPVRTVVHLRCARASSENGHASFLKRDNLPMVPMTATLPEHPAKSAIAPIASIVPVQSIKPIKRKIAKFLECQRKRHSL